MTSKEREYPINAPVFCHMEKKLDMDNHAVNKTKEQTRTP